MKTSIRNSKHIHDKKKKYFPDIYIPKDNLLIEVKSTWTYKVQKKLNELKKYSAINAGYKFELWIIHNEDKIEIIKD